jgi:mannosyltransferase
MSWQVVRRPHFLGLLGVLFLAMGIRCYHLGSNSLWTDEYLSLECSSGWARTDMRLAGTASPVPDLINLSNARRWTTIWSSIANDENHPPLYFVMLRGWRAVFGDSPVAIRSLSVAAAGIAIVLLFSIGVLMHSPGAALWACLLMAVASPQIQQSQDARAYMPMTAACLAAALALLCIDRFGVSRRRCAALFLATLVAPMLHYMAFATVGALVVYAVLLMRGLPRRSVLLSISAGLAVYAILWSPAVVSQHYRMMDGTTWLIATPTQNAPSTLQNLCSLPARLFLDLDNVKVPLACLSVTVFFLPLALFRKERYVALWWIWLMVPALTALLIDLLTRRQSLSMIKYTLVAAPAVYLILGIFATRLAHFGWIPAALIAAGCIACVPSAYQTEQPDWRELSKCILQNSRPGDPVIFVNDDPHAYASNCELSVSYYLKDKNRPLYILDRQPTGAILKQLQKARHLCVVGSSDGSLNWANIPGMKLDHAEMLVGMAIVGTEDPVRPLVASAGGISGDAKR